VDTQNHKNNIRCFSTV